MLNILENVDIHNYSTLKIGGVFRYFVEVDTASDLEKSFDWARSKNVRVLILGGGSNMVFPDGVIDLLAIKINIFGFHIITDDHNYVDINIGAGENWDYVVERAVGLGLSGIEAMSAIPGTAGATPIQNVGAYGQEIKDTLISVEVYKIESNSLDTLYLKDCHFAYRESIFKHMFKDKYVILSINLRLSKLPAKVPNYPGVKKYFEDKGIMHPSLSEIRDAIVDIRSLKLPDPKKIANVGSFFKNPIVEKSVADKLQIEHPKLVVFPVDETSVKVPAGWLIEFVGLKGKDFGKVSVYSHNALVLVNNGSATRADIEAVRDKIIKIVKDKFGIELSAEPEFV